MSHTSRLFSLTAAGVLLLLGCADNGRMLGERLTAGGGGGEEVEAAGTSGISGASGQSGTSVSGGQAGADTGGTDTGGTDTGGTDTGGTDTGGAAGSPPLSDAEICAAGCAESAPYEIPGALCEDWRFPDPDRPADFCGAVSAPQCGPRCTARLGQVSDVCRTALRAAIPCVARNELYSSQLSTTCILSECYIELFRVSAECYGLREELSRARALWNVQATSDYSFTYASGTTSTQIAVTQGVATVTGGDPLASPPTIPALFDQIERDLNTGIPSRVEYDEQLGHPKTLESKRPACDSLPPGSSYSITNLRKV